MKIAAGRITAVSPSLGGGMQATVEIGTSAKPVDVWFTPEVAEAIMASWYSHAETYQAKVVDGLVNESPYPNVTLHLED